MKLWMIQSWTSKESFYLKLSNILIISKYNACRCKILRKNYLWWELIQKNLIKNGPLVNPVKTLIINLTLFNMIPRSQATPCKWSIASNLTSNSLNLNLNNLKFKFELEKILSLKIWLRISKLLNDTSKLRLRNTLTRVMQKLSA